jgi:hypothetical protein
MLFKDLLEDRSKLLADFVFVEEVVHLNHGSFFTAQAGGEFGGSDKDIGPNRFGGGDIGDFDVHIFGVEAKFLEGALNAHFDEQATTKAHAAHGSDFYGFESQGSFLLQMKKNEQKVSLHGDDAQDEGDDDEDNGDQSPVEHLLADSFLV